MPPRSGAGAAVVDGADGEDFYLELGRSLRSRRRDRGLSLAALAAATGLSQSFLSQMERGLVRASFHSLNRVTTALGTTTQAVMAHRAAGRVLVVRAGEGTVFDNARLLTPGGRRVRVMELRDVPSTFGDVYEHPEEELIYVVVGVAEVETDGEQRVLLGAGESVFLAPGVPHRWRRVSEGPFSALLVSQGATGPG